MGVADNKSYKNTHYFRPNVFRRDDSPSLNLQPAINSTIKENPDKSNVEIEGGEIVLKPDLSALFRAVGDKHKAGGMDVFLDNDSFIFSDDKSLAFNKKNIEQMELKMGGKPKSKNTPAKIVQKNVDPKHYNTLIANISDLHADDITKNSSTRMLEKYMETLGNIAYVQEMKKGFPQGLPDFSNGTAPVYEADLKEDIMEQKQYARYGGKVMQRGGWPERTGKRPPIWFPGRFPDEILPPYPEQNPAAPTPPVDTAPTGKYSGVPPKTPNSGVPPKTPYSGVPPKKTYTRGRITITTTPGTIEEYVPPQNPNLIPGEVTGTPGVKRADWEFTPWQRLSQGYQGLKWASLKRYMPYRSHINPSYVDPALVNPEQVVNDMQGAFTTQLQGINSMNPILRNAQASESFGQVLNRIPGVRSQYDNQNQGVKNQFRGINNQTANQTRLQNAQFDQQYYKESITGQANYDNMKTYLGDQWMNNVNQDVQDNQSLAYNLLTQNNPAWNFDWKSGNFTRTNKDIRDAQSIVPADGFEGMMNQIKKLKDDGFSDQVISAIVRGRFLQQAAPYFQQSPLPRKMGGYLRPKK